MNEETVRISRMIEKTWDKSPWYGPSIKSTLLEITAKEADLRAGQSHSIIELVLHMASWREFVVSRLRGDNEFKVTETDNFPAPGPWEDAMKKLEQSQRELLEAAKEFPDARLGELVPHASHKYTFYTLLHGILQHDIYHIGQIQLIRKSVA
jgi:uncharacterized damage-inducible protein DinB